MLRKSGVFNKKQEVYEGFKSNLREIMSRLFTISKNDKI